MSDHVKRLLARMGAVYGPPNTPNLQAFMAEYHFALDGYSPAIIDKAADKVIRENPERWWPTPGKCVEACLAVAAKLDRMKAPEHKLLTDETETGYRSEEAKAHVAEMVADFKRGWAAEKVRQLENETAVVVDPPFTRTQRPGFKNVQRNSPNKGLHRKW